VFGHVGTAAATVLAALLAWAAVSTLVRRGRAGDALRSLHVPGAGVLVVGVPVLELAAAAALVSRPADGAALALVVVAGSHLALTWWAGAGAGCPRIGSGRLDPVSWVDVARNFGLGVLAVVALFGGSQPEVPQFPAVVMVSTAMAIGAVALAGAELRGRVGVRVRGRVGSEVVR
jgi:hypothetical protein